MLDGRPGPSKTKMTNKDLWDEAFGRQTTVLIATSNSNRSSVVAGGVGRSKKQMEAAIHKPLTLNLKP